jgi:D-3-phosphoglycerate dehydrogenase
MAYPRIYWCWPEILAGQDRLGHELSSLGEVHCCERLPAATDRAAILVPRLSTAVDDAVLRHMPDLRLIATPSTGTDHIDIAAARARGIAVLSLREDPEFLKQLQSTAELTWLLILACSRRAPEAFAQALNGHWNSSEVRGRELRGKTIGIVGMGRLGTMVAGFANAFGMRVLGTDVRTVSLSGVEPVPMDTLLKTADIVSVHVHLDESTRHLIGRRELAMMKHGGILVNTSRGDVIDEAALLEALQSGHLRAAGLDVLSGERSSAFASHPLIEYARTDDNLVLTPHIGGATEEAQEKAFNHLVARIAAFWNATPAARTAQ